jgi:hypothetical protein
MVEKTTPKGKRNMTTNGKSRVTSIAMKRVHNLGNYENIQYEVVVEIGEKDNAARVVQTLRDILRDVEAKSGISRHELERAKEQLSKPKSQLTDLEKKRLPEYRKKVRQHEQAGKAREKAMAALQTLNYTRVYKDAKTEWEDDY